MAKAQKPVLHQVAEGFDKMLLRWVTDEGKLALDRNNKPLRDNDGKLVYKPLKACDMNVIFARLKQCDVLPRERALEQIRDERGVALQLTDDMPPSEYDEAS